MFFNVSHPKRLIFLTRLCVGLSHLREQNFKHSFLDTLNIISICGFDVETSKHFFIHCPRFANEKQNLLLKIETSIPGIFRKAGTSVTSIIFYGNPNFLAELNTNILNSSIDYILTAKSFESVLFTETRLDL